MNDDISRDLYHRLGTIEAKVDDIRTIRDTADKAQATANEALHLAKATAEDIGGMQSEQANNRRWLIGLIVSTIFSVLGVIFAILSATM